MFVMGVSSVRGMVIILSVRDTPASLTTAIVSNFTIQPFHLFTAPVEMYEESTWFQTYSICQIKTIEQKRVSDFIVKLYYNVTRSLFSAGDLEISGVKRFMSKRL